MNISRFTDLLLRLLVATAFALLLIPERWRPLQVGYGWMAAAAVVLLLLIGELVVRKQPRA